MTNNVTGPGAARTTTTEAELRTLFESMRVQGLTTKSVEVLLAEHKPDGVMIPADMWSAGTPGFVSPAAACAYGVVSAAGAQFRPTVLTIEQVARAYGKSTRSTSTALTELAERGWLLVADQGTRGRVYRALMWPIENDDDPRIAEHAVAAAGFKRTPRDRSIALRDAINKRRQAVLDDLVATHGPKCFYCDHSPEDVYELHVEHRQPVSRGGTNDPGNLVPACEHCNALKGDMAEAEFYAFLETAFFEGGL